MRRISSQISTVLILLVGLSCLAPVGDALAANAVSGSSVPSKAALSKAVQEALAKQGLSTGSAEGGSASSGGLESSDSMTHLTEGGGEEEEETPKTAATTSSSGVSTGVLVPIGIVGAALLGAIAYFIVRDARNVAPAADGLGGARATQERAARLAKRRAKAKAARQQRKRNR